MALKILVADPDEAWLAKAKENLSKKIYDVDIVTNGRDAQVKIYNAINDKKNYFAVILNYNLQQHSGAQVLKFIKSNYTSQRVIIIIDSEEMYEDGMLSDDKLVKMGATDVIKKPFSLDELADSLEGHQSLGDLVSNLKKNDGVSEEEEVNDKDSQFTAIRIDEFYSAKAVLFDVFIKLGSGRYVKILHAGDTFSKERIDKYKNEKNIEHLYFNVRDRRKYVQYNNYISSKLVVNKKLDSGRKVNLMKNVTEKFLEDAFTTGMKPQVIQQGREICENVYKLVEKDDNLYALLRTYQDFDPSAFSHAFLVTLFSTSIIKQFEWQSRTMIENTALACMFHDIGKTQLPKELLDKKKEDMSEDELALYKSHPIEGAKLVEGNRMIKNSVKQIILQHHEAYNGTGFPNGAKGNAILTLANIVGLADSFSHMLVEENIAPVAALKKILADQNEVAKYNSVIIENFIKVFVEPDKIKKDYVLPSNSKVVSKKVS